MRGWLNGTASACRAVRTYGSSRIQLPKNAASGFVGVRFPPRAFYLLDNNNYFKGCFSDGRMRTKVVLEKALGEGIALTFDDVRLRTGYSEVMPDEVSLSTQFSRNVCLKIPLVSAAMDTVTEYKLAIALAKLGGLGIIHRNLSPEEQVFHVAKVKHHLHGRTDTPICVSEDQTIASILEMRELKKYSFNSFPVLDSRGEIVGILTGNDFEFCDDHSQLARDVMSTEILSAPPQTTIEEAYTIMKREKKKVLPLVDLEGKVTGMYVFSDVKRIMTGSAEFYNVDERGQLRVGAAIGTGEEAFARLEKLVKERVDVVVIDTAHGDSKAVIETLRELKRMYPRLDAVVGNVSIGDSVKRLVDAGADGIKVGQGPGSICTTRIISGIGRPQVSAIYECVKVAEKYHGVPVCADGGIRNSGDIPIAIAAGAHSVMMGSLFAGTDEAPGEVVYIQGRQWKNYRGMGSLGAMESFRSSRERYGQKSMEKNRLIPEGIEGLITYKGKLADVVFQYLGGLRRGMGYVGAKSVEELREKGDFDRITSAGFAESHVHDVMIAKEAPNYRKEDEFR